MTNELLKLVFVVFASYGMTTILVYGKIFEGARTFIKSKSNFFGELISCVLCTSTWVGVFMSILFSGLSNNLWTDLYIIPTIFLDAMFIAGSVWALNSFIEYFEENRTN
jgi:hypothetical protein